MSNKSAIFIDGICPKCGGGAYGYSLSAPMRCGECGEIVEILNSDIDLAIKTIQELREESGK